jgi:hypothetical protein
MELSVLNPRPEFSSNEKINKKLSCLTRLIEELKKREIPEPVQQTIETEIRNINSFIGSEKDFLKTLAKAQSNILKTAEKDARLVVKNHYRNLWLPLGMSAFGIPFGVVFGISLGNMAFLGIGLPIGMAMGVAVGSGLDNKAAKEGRQLDVELSA